MEMTPQSERFTSAALKANRRMSYYLLAFLIILFVLAGLTFPFVDHTAQSQNILYGLVVAAPFIIINIVFIITTGKDLSKTPKP
jgi:hypothetical protein